MILEDQGCLHDKFEGATFFGIQSFLGDSFPILKNCDIKSFSGFQKFLRNKELWVYSFFVGEAFLWLGYKKLFCGWVVQEAFLWVYEKLFCVGVPKTFLCRGTKRFLC